MESEEFIDFSPFRGVSFFKLMETFPTEESCKKYLYQVKFRDGFHCPRCKHTASYKGIKPYTHRCKKCRYMESATANTLFHKLKFPLQKAFAIIFEMTTSSAGLSAAEASRKFDIHHNSAWLFMKKVRISMASSAYRPLKGNVYIDEYVIGGYEKGAVGRKNKSSKIKAVIAVETTNKTRIKRCYSMLLKDYSTKELRSIFAKHVSKERAHVFTDKWRSYIPLKKEWKITQHEKYKKYSPVNRMIQQLKSWLRGTHHWVSAYHTQTYLNEYSYRINRSIFKDIVFHNCVERMMAKPKKYRMEISQVQIMPRERAVERIRIFKKLGVPFVIRNGKVKASRKAWIEAMNR